MNEFVQSHSEQPGNFEDVITKLSSSIERLERWVIPADVQKITVDTPFGACRDGQLLGVIELQNGTVSAAISTREPTTRTDAPDKRYFIDKQPSTSRWHVTVTDESRPDGHRYTLQPDGLVRILDHGLRGLYDGDLRERLTDDRLPDTERAMYELLDKTLYPVSTDRIRETSYLLPYDSNNNLLVLTKTTHNDSESYSLAASLPAYFDHEPTLLHIHIDQDEKGIHAVVFRRTPEGEDRTVEIYDEAELARAVSDIIEGAVEGAIDARTEEFLDTFSIEDITKEEK